MSTDPDLDLDLDRRLTALADRAPHDAPDVALDLGRGRRRLRRRRAAAGAGAVGVVAAATLVLTLLPGGASLRDDPGPAGQGTSPSIAVDDDTDPAATERELAPGESLGVTTSDDLLGVAAEGYARVLAERLDPTGTHAAPTDSVQSSGTVGDLSSLGTRVGWRVPGEAGQGVVAVVVGRSPGSASWTCDEPGWTCADLPAPQGATAARRATYDGGEEVMVTRADGLVVTVSTSTLDASNSLEPVAAVDLTTEQLAAAAADPRLVLPTANTDDPADTAGVLPVPSVEDRLAGDATVLRVGREVLLPAVAGESSERLGGGPKPDGHDFLHLWRWAGPGGEGVVGWSVDGSPSARVSGTCIRAYERCVVRTEAGREVFVGYRRDGGWSVWAPGPVRTMSVSLDGTGFPLDRALALVLDPRLQQPPR